MDLKQILNDYIDSQVNAKIDYVFGVLATQFPEVADILGANTIDTSSIQVEANLEEDIFKIRVDGNDSVGDYLFHKVSSKPGLNIDVMTDPATGAEYLELSLNPTILVKQLIDYNDGTTVYTPSILIPRNFEETPLSITLQLSDFKSDDPAETFVRTEWLVATDPAFTNTILNTSSNNPTTMPLSLPNPATTYYVKARHVGSSTTSRWSNTSIFVTQYIGIQTPTIVNPPDNSSNVDRLTRIVSSTINTINLTETHVSSDWQVATDSNFTNVVYTSTNDTTNLTSLPPVIDIGLVSFTTYYVRVRYRTANYVSDWSPASVFSTGYWELSTEIQGIDSSIFNEGYGASIGSNATGSMMVVGTRSKTTINHTSTVRWYNRVGSTYNEMAHEVIPNPDYVGEGNAAIVDCTEDMTRTAVGLPYTSTSSMTRPGKVVIFQSDGVQVSNIQEIVSPVPVDHGMFGKAVAISESGSYLAIAENSNVSFQNEGAIYLFRLSGALYTYVARVLSPNAMIDGEFGSSLELIELADGTIVLYVGAPNETVNGLDNAGRVYKYIIDPVTHDITLSLTIASIQQFSLAQFGYAIKALEDGSVLIGSPADQTPTGMTTGSVTVLTNTGLFEHKFYGLHQLERFGSSIGATRDGLNIAIGAPDRDTTGKVDIFRFDIDALSYYLVRTLGSDMLAAGDLFGESVLIHRDVEDLVVGAPGSNNGNGSVYVFD